MKVKKIEDKTKKKTIVLEILRGLPMWFGIESSVNEYVEKAETQIMFAAFDDEVFVGFLTLEQHSTDSIEVYCMGVDKTYHRKGVGTLLLEQAEIYSKQNDISFLTVKTLSEDRENKYYEKTRKFYKKMGFKKLEVFPSLWGEANPCLQLIKWIGETHEGSENNC